MYGSLMTGGRVFVGCRAPQVAPIQPRKRARVTQVLVFGFIYKGAFVLITSL